MSRPKTHWNDFSDRGWFKALCAPYDRARRFDYTYETTPVIDTEVPDGWREQVTLGSYLDYGPDHYRSPEARAEQPGNILALCHAPHRRSRYVETIAEAKAWIEAETRRVRPELFSVPAPELDALWAAQEVANG